MGWKQMMVSISQRERKIAPVSPHQLINHFANVFVKSHAVWISNRFATNMFVVNLATTFFSTSRSVCPTSALSPPHRWSSITSKLEISAKFWLPSKSQFLGCDLSRKQWQWKGKKMLKEAVSVACRGWGYQICSLALRTSTWHLPENMLCAQNISNSFREKCIKM